MTIDVEKILLRMGAETYTVTRWISGAYDEETGKYEAGETEEVEILASVQPLGPEEIASFPEGERDKERFRFFSAAPLQLGDSDTGRKADVVQIGDRKYEASSVERWNVYTKTIVTRIPSDAD